jgi:hypothetical protein
LQLKLCTQLLSLPWVLYPAHVVLLDLITL